jgi:hypothetical protein
MKSATLICVCVLIGGCSRADRWISAWDIREMSSRHVIELNLKSGEKVQFDETMAWYDRDHDRIEGRSLRRDGADTIRLQDVQSVHLPAETNTGATVALIWGFALTAGLVWWVVHFFGDGGG